ncbi:hypothetical protein [Chryseobacterium sp. PCH239]|nr:hypothetical protein [Chryseobacterium sp. PCH239]
MQYKKAAACGESILAAVFTKPGTPTEEQVIHREVAIVPHLN